LYKSSGPSKNWRHSDNSKPGGLADYVLGDLGTIIKFDEMIHGWTTRGGKEPKFLPKIFRNF